MANNSTGARLLNRIDKTGQSALGQCGAILINDTAAHAGDFIAITAITDTVTLANATTASNYEDFDADIVLAKGVTIFGQFSSITLVGSGVCIAYKEC